MTDQYIFNRVTLYEYQHTKFFGVDANGLRTVTCASTPLTTNRTLLRTAKRMTRGRMGIRNRIRRIIVHGGTSKHSDAVAMYSYNKTYYYIGDALSRVEGAYLARAYQYPITIY